MKTVDPAVAKRCEVGAYLRLLAGQVEDGHVIAFETKWDGGMSVESAVTLLPAIDEITVNIAIEDGGDG